MSRIFLYAHGGSGNHGCEAIVRSTADMLNGKNFYLISGRPDEDRFYGIAELCDIIKDRSDNFEKKSLDFLKAYIALKLKKDFIPMDKLQYKAAFSNIKKGDIALSIGGDNYCYADVNKYIMLHDMLKKRGAKTVFWGCSIEPEVAARPDVAKDLARYDLITARETISYEALKAVNPNTKLVADPAFVLKAKETALPKGFDPGNTVGINLSPMAMDLESVPGIAFENYKNLIAHVIKHTDMQVALIPHVVWAEGDDRIPLKKLYDEFADSGRVVIVGDCSCQELKYLISKCRFFVGARTHATIAAYSSCVPTLVLGYSVKSRGIARDLFGTEDGYVVPVQTIKQPDAVLQAFLHILEHEKEMLHTLKQCIPTFKEKALQAANYLFEK
ncbi:MAG: polysaccharide pyruvyl transferase family protein [Ruminococcaceae bacterium]|nr:polysaccharide pyruvyl transferase family protein [Oscillospiraceae bacterium]